MNYYIGLAYKALGEKSKTDEFFKKAAGKEARSIDVMNYYQGLSYAELGKNNNATKVFELMIEEASKQLDSPDVSEAGVIFGEREDENVRKSRYYTMRGLGLKGLKKIKQAIKDLNSEVELSYSNLWAKVELDEI